MHYPLGIYSVSTVLGRPREARSRETRGTIAALVALGGLVGEEVRRRTGDYSRTSSASRTSEARR